MRIIPATQLKSRRGLTTPPEREVLTMMMKALFVVLALLAAGSAIAAAPSSLEVEGVQMPAWVERARGARLPLAIGMTLNSKDRVYTGPGARALLRLADGSLVKLGENAILALDDLGRTRIDLKDVVTASLDVLSGAFRFTTQAVRQFRGERDVKVRIASITAGIRGTDLWGKAEDARDILCLIEGSVTVVRGADAFTMDQPMSFYVAPKDAAAQPVAAVSPQQLDAWSAETELSAGWGASVKGGAWRVYLAEADNQDDALRVYDQLREAGYAAEIRPVKSDKGYRYRVRLAHLPSLRDAAILAVRLAGTMGVVAEPRVSR